MARYAKKDVYAEVPEEGGMVNRLVAVRGQPVPRAFDHLVDDGDTDDSPPSPLGPDRSTAARRARTPTVAEAEEARAGESEDEDDSAPARRRSRRS